ncbi:TIGR03089 family protein [Actinomyces minihominis]|uniref:TIGR03089 family protein n=1 Tax=Actinomyces minihominis TaxID=2002838 RepID=UPI000C0775D3|nr:TIGR03089 family protein [Actinomyces minihominis]
MNQLDATVLTSLLSPRPGPVLTWFESPAIKLDGSVDTAQGRDRIELSGPVARRWIAKTDNFMASEFPFGATGFTTSLPAHWRTPFWIAVCWMRGLEKRAGGTTGGLDLAVSDSLGFLTALQEEIGPDVLIAQTTDSLAFAWPGELPFGITDGIADVMSYADEVEMPHTANQDTLLVSEGVEWFSADLAAGAAPLTLKGILATDYLGLDEEALNDLAGQRVLVTTGNPTLFTVQLLQLWLHGASVVWVPGGHDAERIGSSERVTLTIGEGSPHSE